MEDAQVCEKKSFFAKIFWRASQILHCGHPHFFSVFFAKCLVTNSVIFSSENKKFESVWRSVSCHYFFSQNFSQSFGLTGTNNWKNQSNFAKNEKNFAKNDHWGKQLENSVKFCEKWKNFCEISQKITHFCQISQKILRKMTFFAKLCEKLIFRKRGHPPILQS